MTIISEFYVKIELYICCQTVGCNVTWGYEKMTKNQKNINNFVKICFRSMLYTPKMSKILFHISHFLSYS